MKMLSYQTIKELVCSLGFTQIKVEEGERHPVHFYNELLEDVHIDVYRTMCDDGDFGVDGLHWTNERDWDLDWCFYTFICGGDSTEEVLKALTEKLILLILDEMEIRLIKEREEIEKLQKEMNKELARLNELVKAKL